ncbi:fructose-6-phosphate aldolase [uncultured Vagococcus sp.]|uniref:fructose-6-phosphate aldolase n=1 Tax=uncultured Vagococcus sp. TaxID=189676 RepID=UPI0025854499|nr:fructose-6-phosphate aldolase [uncultured Vagococcus sp.]
MELMLDTIELDKIALYNECLNISGVTSNPSIIKKHGKINIESHMKEIRKIIGPEKSLHIQVVGVSSEDMIADARKIINEIDQNAYVKIPTTTEGLKAMKELKKEGFNVTATAIYSIFQGLMAINVGADYIAPYFNRMENMGVNSLDVLTHLQNEIDRSKSETKILAASFKNSKQVVEALSTGAKSVTIGTEIIEENLDTAAVNQAVIDFNQDWFSLYNKNSI